MVTKKLEGKLESENGAKNGNSGNNSVKKKYLITSAQYSYYEDGNGELRKWGKRGEIACLNENFYSGLKRFADETGAEIKILPIAGCSIKEDIFHSSIEDLDEIYEWSRRFKKLNENVTLSDILVPPQNVDPATSRKHLPSTYRATLIYPHSKQRLCPVPSHKSPLPRFLATTGSITYPNFNRGNDRGDQAWRDHVFGAILLDIQDSTYFIMRFLTAQKNGKFVDVGKEYDGNKRPKKIRVEALVLGDYHFGEHDEDTMNANYEMIEELSPKKLVIHDFFSGQSISHWQFEKLLSRTQDYRKGKLDLEKELEELYFEMNNLSKKISKKGEIYIVHSNHDDFLAKYLEKGMWRDRDLWNSAFCYNLIGGILKNDTPEDGYLKEALSSFGDIPKKVHFLKLTDSLAVSGYQLAVHGHIGKNGSKGMSIKGVDETIGKGVIGHKHAPEQFRNSYVVGTSSRLDLKFMHGSASAAMGANLAIYGNGSAQMLPIINGRWKLSEK
ncbi:MAG: hypothetical protein V1660_04135 [archaeon]